MNIKIFSVINQIKNINDLKDNSNINVQKENKENVK
jgi:hypothetical protein